MQSVLWSLGSLLLGALLGLVVAQSAEAVPLAAGATVAVYGVAALLSVRAIRRRVPFARTKDDRDDILRVALGRHLAEGNALIEEVASLTTEADHIVDVKRRAEAWGRRAADELDRERPGWRSVFLDDSGIAQFASQYGDRDLVRNWLERRLIRLRELQTRLG
ncbi:MAG: hypothetical protein C0498_08510 [Anaerolinea sp.]|nr:hypothetical protein [Anaerolinea sp.]